MRNDAADCLESGIARDILAYLSIHPSAKDTLVGITEWWLLEQRIRYETDRVEAALAELAEKGFILQEERPGVGPVYWLNTDRARRTGDAPNGQAGQRE